MKVRDRSCDICGRTKLWDTDFQFWLRKPKVWRGYPSFGMKKMDICESCFVELEVLIREREKAKEKQEQE